MKTALYQRIIVSSTIIAGLIALPIFSTNPFIDIISLSTAATVHAQSQPQPTQQQSQPPEKQPQQLGTQHIFNNKSKPANAPEFCASLASVVSGKGLPDYNLCDVVVYRQAPAITRNDGLVVNNFSGIGHYIEFLPAVLNNTGAFQANTTSQNMSAAFGEWALLDSEVVPVQNIMQKYNWTQTALHHHLLGESPKILFLHWSVTGNANDLINQAKEIMMQTSTYDDQAPRAPTSAGP
jgi:hypothetical protein